MLFEMDEAEANSMTQEDTEGDYHGFWVYNILQPPFGGMKVHLPEWRWWIGQMTDEIFGENGQSMSMLWNTDFSWKDILEVLVNIQSQPLKNSKSGSLACGSISSSTIRAMSRKPTRDGEPSER